MNDQPQVVPIPKSLRAKILERNREFVTARERLEEAIEMTRDVLADYGTPVPMEEYDLGDCKSALC